MDCCSLVSEHWWTICRWSAGPNSCKATQNQKTNKNRNKNETNKLQQKTKLIIKRNIFYTVKINQTYIHIYIAIVLTMYFILLQCICFIFLFANLFSLETHYRYHIFFSQCFYVFVHIIFFIFLFVHIIFFILFFTKLRRW